MTTTQGAAKTPIEQITAIANAFTNRFPSEAALSRMLEIANTEPLSTLADRLAEFSALPKLTRPQVHVRGALIRSIVKRSPAASAAFDAWADSASSDEREAGRAIVTAVKAG